MADPETTQAATGLFSMLSKWWAELFGGAAVGGGALSVGKKFIEHGKDIESLKRADIEHNVRMNSHSRKIEEVKQELGTTNVLLGRIDERTGGWEEDAKQNRELLREVREVLKRDRESD